MSEKILFVDDDPNLLASVERSFRRQFVIETAAGGESALKKLAENGPFAVVVTDRHMPRMDGIELLAQVKLQAPLTIRLMLTGNADLEAAVRVVNEGNIFRFLTKPCPTDVLAKALRDALAQYRLVNAEKELLGQTLSGSIKLLTDILSLVETQSFGRAQAMREEITTLTTRLQISNAWEIHLAVMLAPIGFVTIPPETLLKSRAGKPLSEAEEQVLLQVPEVASRLLANIPRLGGVARIVRYQHKHFDGSGLPSDAVAGESIPLGSRLLKILLDRTQLQNKGLSRQDALGELAGRAGRYDPALLAVLRADPGGGSGPVVQAAGLSVSLRLPELCAGMVLRSNVVTRDGLLILTAGHRLTEMALEKLRNFERVSGIKEPILVEASELNPVGE